jgi:hypothetical protein
MIFSSSSRTICRPDSSCCLYGLATRSRHSLTCVKRWKSTVLRPVPAGGRPGFHSEELEQAMQIPHLVLCGRMRRGRAAADPPALCLQSAGNYRLLRRLCSRRVA